MDINIQQVTHLHIHVGDNTQFNLQDFLSKIHLPENSSHVVVSVPTDNNTNYFHSSNADTFSLKDINPDSVDDFNDNKFDNPLIESPFTVDDEIFIDTPSYEISWFDFDRQFVDEDFNQDDDFDLVRDIIEQSTPFNGYPSSISQHEVNDNINHVDMGIMTDSDWQDKLFIDNNLSNTQSEQPVFDLSQHFDDAFFDDNTLETDAMPLLFDELESNFHSHSMDFDNAVNSNFMLDANLSLAFESNDSFIFDTDSLDMPFDNDDLLIPSDLTYPTIQDSDFSVASPYDSAHSISVAQNSSMDNSLDENLKDNHRDELAINFEKALAYPVLVETTVSTDNNIESSLVAEELIKEIAEPITSALNSTVVPDNNPNNNQVGYDYSKKPLILDDYDKNDIARDYQEMFANSSTNIDHETVSDEKVVSHSDIQLVSVPSVTEPLLTDASESSVTIANLTPNLETDLLVSLNDKTPSDVVAAKSLSSDDINIVSSEDAIPIVTEKKKRTRKPKIKEPFDTATDADIKSDLL